MKRILFLVVCLWIVVIGCNRGLNTQYVTGVITLDGKPLPEASITFHPVDESNGQTAGGYSDQNGVYQLSSLHGKGGAGALAAEYVVLVTKSEQVLLPTPQVEKEDGSVTTHMSRSILLPAYQSRDKTPLRVEVKPGKNSIDLELFSKLP